jgi:hypothetical protein
MDSIGSADSVRFGGPHRPKFQAYIITCAATGKRYVGITSASLAHRWTGHRFSARRRPDGTALHAAISAYGASAFTIESVATAKSWGDLRSVEETLIRQWNTLTPFGYNMTIGGEGRRFGFHPSAESVERSAAKHRGKPCHQNTRDAAIRTHRGKPKPTEHRAKIAAAKRGVPRPDSVKIKLSEYWAKRRAAGEFKTSAPYEHSRKAASAMLAEIPFPLAQHIARVFKPTHS